MQVEVDANDAYDAFARRVIAGGILLDPWMDGEPRFSPETLVLSAEKHRALTRVGEEVAELYDEACRLVDEDEALARDFFGLTPAQQLRWDASRPLWHGLARADVFETREGYVITELNCDTPTGEAEAVVLSDLALATLRGTGATFTNPNAGLERAFGAMVEVLIDRLVDGPAPRSIGIVYPTEFTEDLSVIRLYRRWLEGLGFAVVLGSPYNLGAESDGRATLFGRPVAAILRHYKTDGWGERASAWDDETLADALPLAEPLGIALRASLERKTAVINPFGAVVPQNKRTMAFMWEHVHRFSTRARGLVEKYVPYTSRLETIHKERLLAEREDWVLKSDYGAEGDEVIIGRGTSDAEWAASLDHARPGRWIAQRYFEALPENGPGGAGQPLNYGVFLVGGEASGLYVRRQAGATDDRAVSVPVLVR
ncbi:MAG TPA: glutathionylspermidine synthase family protein [Thermoanaerobaculia bacterium]|nr:glutathionylspermidine synthase family protein [Thermoanaerobaculia bacterium]